MTQETMRKNLKAMAVISNALLKIDGKLSSKVLSLLLNSYLHGSDGVAEAQTLLACAKKLAQLDRDEAEAALKYLIDLHMRPEDGIAMPVVQDIG